MLRAAGGVVVAGALVLALVLWMVAALLYGAVCAAAGAVVRPWWGSAG